MAQEVLALCDGNIHYGSRLAAYLEQQKAFPLRILFFSDTAQLMKCMSDICPQYLLLSEEIYSELSEGGLPAYKRLFLLRKKKEKEECGTSRITTIYRYQQAGNIMRAILAELGEEPGRDGRRLKNNTGTKIIGVYTPIRRSMQTSFSILLGQVLAAEERTLYINMEGYSGFRSLLGRELKPDITDLMFLAKEEGESYVRLLECMINTIGRLEYIPPASAFIDLAAVTKEQWLKLLQEIRKDGRFSYLVLDVTEQIQGMFQVLEECDVIYTIEGADAIAQAKLYEYEQLLSFMEYDRIREKTKKKKLPSVHFAEMNFERLLYSELAGYVRSIAKEDFGLETG
ncbi:MAG: hypothetical protein K2K87_12065 [Lachnospiraceae bacterium]|nr:hypothetical protein [Lachnospiraceae bacterium]